CSPAGASVPDGEPFGAAVPDGEPFAPSIVPVAAGASVSPPPPHATKMLTASVASNAGSRKRNAIVQEPL
ncbi:MAG: hypothetical protein J4N26_04870, partial [Chloroflexi bacterium]|nr:hypothetical protein [Chloroflexota bacterium]